MAKKRKVSGAGRSFGATLKADTPQEMTPEEELQVPLDLSLQGIVDRWKRNVIEPALSYMEYEPRTNKFMDALALATDVIEPEKAAAAKFLFTPKALEKTAYSFLRNFAKKVPKGSPAREAFEKTYRGKDIIVGDKFDKTVMDYAREQGLTSPRGALSPSGLKKPGSGKSIPKVVVDPLHPDFADPESMFTPRRSFGHEAGGHAGFRELSPETRLRLRQAAGKTGAHPMANYGDRADESYARAIEDFLEEGKTNTKPEFDQIIQELLTPKPYQKGGKVPDFMELIQLLLNPPQGQTQFQSGGMVPNATFRMPTADLMKMAQGGPVPPPEPLIPNVASTAQNYQPNVAGSTAQAGTVGQTAQNVSQFNPFQGQGASTLNQMLSTGRPTNVAPITQAAISEGEQFFNDQLGAINEQMGAFGLSSSTARTGAIADALSKIGTNIGNEGLRAGVGAQESAANRSAGALNPFFAGTGQQLGAQTAGLQGQLGAGNLLLGGEQAVIQGQLGAMNNLTNLGLGLAPIQNQQMNQVPQGLPRTVTSPVNSPRAGIGSNRGFVSAASAANPYKVGGGMSAVGGGRGGSRLGGYARGGSVTPDRYVANQGSGRTDFGDYMSQLLYGQKFNRMVPEEIPEIPQFQMPKIQSPQFIQPQQPMVQQQPIKSGLHSGKWMNPAANAQRAADAYSFAKGLLGGPIGQAMSGPAYLDSLYRTISGIGIPAAHEGMMQSGRIEGSNKQAAMQAAAGIAEAMNNPMSLALQMGINPFGQGSQSKQEGGYIDGPSVPPDQVPILAQGGEGVIPVKMMAELQKSKSSDPLIQKLQDLMGFACGGKVGKYEKGGKVKKMQKGGLASKARPGSPASSEPYTSSVTYDPTAAAGYEDPVNAALRRLSLIQSAMTLDPQGGGIQQSGPGMIAQQQQVLEPLLQARQQEEQRAAAEQQAEAQRQHEAKLAGQQEETQRAQIEATKDATIAREQMWQQKGGDPFEAALSSAAAVAKSMGTNEMGEPNLSYSKMLELAISQLAPYQDDPRYQALVAQLQQLKEAEAQQPTGNLTNDVQNPAFSPEMLDQEVPPEQLNNPNFYRDLSMGYLEAQKSLQGGAR